ncbi:unnamed protein product [Ceutorhynchus assimilis]|uniref:Uncharacterized protein n=1 Tax=Ceutorhynchus assimilis TaxID=467358 RepID=A0A9N9MJM6_9CUCU|nr:unnamed protein product [Ceutorhynchus assimilis]
MSLSRHCFLIFLLIILFNSSHLQRIVKSLSPIRIHDETDKFKVETTAKSKVSIKKIVQEKSLAKLIGPTEYDSLDDVEYAGDLSDPIYRKKKNIKQWDHWGKWSECTVTCGVGKTTRWRHCVSEGCAPGEKEAQIKTCTRKPC